MDNLRLNGTTDPVDSGYPSLTRTGSANNIAEFSLKGTQVPMPTQPELVVTSEPGVFPVTIDIEALHQQCVRDGIKLVRQCFLNNSGTLATYMVPTAVFFRRHAVKGRGMVPGLQTLPIGEDEPVWDLVRLGLVDLAKEVDFKPDWTTFKYLPQAPGHAFCLGLTYTRDPADTPWEHDPRWLLRKLSDKLKEKYNLKMVCGTESEFYIYAKTDPQTGRPLRLDETLYASSHSLHGPVGHMFDEMILANEAAGIGIYDTHSEIGPGQFEIATDPSEVNQCAFELMLTREIIHGVARKNGAYATFAPKPFPNEVGTGCHIHISLADATTGRNIFPSPSDPHGIHPLCASFMAGILEHARAMCAITMPTVGSYMRAQPGMFASAYTAWGNENREVCLRVATAPPGPPNNVEFRFCDATANPFTVMAALLIAGMDGMDRKLALGEPCQDMNMNDVTQEQLEARGIYRAPTSLIEAVDHLSKDRVLLEGMGKLGPATVHMRRYEAGWWGKKSYDDQCLEMIKRF
ncbi:hypothetical protein DFJ74DRAFT_697676 [Hyaloraphidium curvatum]|nr:hypothetical protein DFJ74DRAFT_697676 [Hyaloraphidium curvatum]